MDLSKIRVMGVEKKQEASIHLFSLKEVLDCYNRYNEFGQKRILVVDDEEFCISSMKAILHSCGINVELQVDFCINGKEAVN